MSDKSRYARFLTEVENRGLDGFIVTHPPNLCYLFNFTGSSAIAVLLGGDCLFLLDSRYTEQAEQQVCNAKLILSEGPIEVGLERLLRERSPNRIGFESQHLSHKLFASISTLNGRHSLVPETDLIEQLRMIKDSSEVETIEHAFRLAQSSYGRASQRFSAGKTETLLAGELEYEMRRSGGSGTAFDTIVASGPRSALPHGVASQRTVESGDWILVDFGIRYHEYCSDLTRVFFLEGVNRPSILNVVQEAQQAALQSVRPGVPAKEVDAAARQVISRYGYGEFFGHGTGHGLGLEVHELPRVSLRSSEELQEGMILTIEPGIYLPGRYGIRLEDAVVVTTNGYRYLSDPSV